MGRHGRYIPNRLRKHRKISGYTLEEVAQHLGIKRISRISLWENGHAYPSIKNLYKLSALYGTLADELYFDLRLEFRRELIEKMKKNK